MNTKPRTSCRSQALVTGRWKRHLLGLGFGVKGAGQSVLGGVGLLIEELAADLMFPGQVADLVELQRALG